MKAGSPLLGWELRKTVTFRENIAGSLITICITTSCKQNLNFNYFLYLFQNKIVHEVKKCFSYYICMSVEFFLLPVSIVIVFRITAKNIPVDKAFLWPHHSHVLKNTKSSASPMSLYFYAIYFKNNTFLIFCLKSFKLFVFLFLFVLCTEINYFNLNI